MWASLPAVFVARSAGALGVIVRSRSLVLHWTQNPLQLRSPATPHGKWSPCAARASAGLLPWGHLRAGSRKSGAAVGWQGVFAEARTQARRIISWSERAHTATPCECAPACTGAFSQYQFALWHAFAHAQSQAFRPACRILRGRRYRMKDSAVLHCMHHTAVS